MEKELQALQDAHAAAADLAAREGRLRAEHAEACEALTDITESPAPLPEIDAHIDTVVDAYARTFDDEHGRMTVHAFSGEWSLSRDGQLQGMRAPRVPDLLPHALTLRDLCGLVPDAMKARFKALARVHVYDAGPPMRDRPAFVADYQARIAAIEARHTELVDACAAVGITMELLPAVKVRRATEAAKVVREAEELERRRVAEAALNRSRAAGGRRTRGTDEGEQP